MGFCAYAGPDDRVRDELITTTDRSCGIHYLTNKNTIGWYITEVEGTCLNGLLDGMGHISLRNAFGKVVQETAGFFVQGYPMESNYGNINLKTLLLGDTNQELIFDLGSEERLDIKYMGKMTSTRQSDDTYSAFDACHPAVVLAVTPHLDLFEDEAVQQELINSVINRVAPVCPETNQIYFYGSDKDNPENKDIAFFADINLESGHIKVRRLPSSPRLRDVLTNPADAMDIPIPKEIRRETGLPVVQVTPVKPESKPAPAVPPTEKSKQQVIPLSVTPAPAQMPVLPKTAPAPQPLPTTESIAPQPVPAPEPVLAQSQPQPQTPEPTSLPAWDDIPALLTAARLLKQPVDGKALIHIARFDAMGIALTDGPVALRVKGNNLPLGWVVVQGLFSYTPPQNGTDALGFVQVQSFTPTGGK